MPHAAEPTSMVYDGLRDMDHELDVAITIERGNAENLRRPVLGPVFTIGSALDCDLVLGDMQFPSYHSYVYVRGSRVSLRHMGFGPELTVNGREFRWGELRDADRVRTGPYQFSINIRPQFAKKQIDKKQVVASANNPIHTIHDAYMGSSTDAASGQSAWPPQPVHLRWQSITGKDGLNVAGWHHL